MSLVFHTIATDKLISKMLLEQTHPFYFNWPTLSLGIVHNWDKTVVQIEVPEPYPSTNGGQN